MKIQVTMKRPDALDEGIQDAVNGLTIDGLDADELEIVKEERAEKARKLASRWFEYGEYLTVEIDTEAQTCVVVEVNQ